MNKNEPLFLGDNIRQLRLNNGLTQTQLGNFVGLSKRMIAHYEKHATKPPAVKVAALAKALNVRIEDLFKTSTPKSKIGHKFARKLEKAKTLSKENQQILTTMIDSMLKKKKQ